MELADAIKLIGKGIPSGAKNEVWIDLGAGSGLFTEALATLLGKSNVVYAIDKDKSSWNSRHVEGFAIHFLQLDFLKEDLGLDPVYGVLMANALHFVRDKKSFLVRLRTNVRNGGRLIVVEYEMKRANPWIPYPIGFGKLKELAGELGWTTPEPLEKHSSHYVKDGIYSAVLRF